jgi:hypothetical protein
MAARELDEGPYQVIENLEELLERGPLARDRSLKNSNTINIIGAEGPCAFILR